LTLWPSGEPRLKRRARADDTDEVIRHRFNVYRGQTETLMRNYRKELITIDGGAPSMESSHRCDEPYGDIHRSETSRV
jgi:adenylate kinase family enzyme